MPISVAEAAPIRASAERAFITHLMLDKGEGQIQAETRARDVCAREISRLISGGGGGFYAIMQDNHRVGGIWVAVRHQPHPVTWHLLFIEIDLQHRRRGIGRKAMIRLAEVARLSGATAVTLNVSPRNLPALELYDRVGFRRYDKGLILSLT